jgi:hypothetical protein
MQTNFNMENPPNIIAISGRMGHGKDTVAQMIQYLVYLEENVDSFPYIFSEFIEDNMINLSTWRNKKMAGKLKTIASILTGIPASKFESQDFKNSYLPSEWNDKDNNPMKVREFLQLLGTDAMRNNLHVNTWVNSFWADYKGYKDKWLITDLRFPNEYDSVVDRKGITIRVVRDIPVPENEHASEKGLDGYNFDYTIKNDGSLNSLLNKTREILVDLKIIT